jgi:hypothetical protein
MGAFDEEIVGMRAGPSSLGAAICRQEQTMGIIMLRYVGAQYPILYIYPTQ